MPERFKITKEGYDKLKSKLDYFINVERPANSKAIGEAIALGDLSENAEFIYSKEKQTMINATIAQLSDKIASADIVYIENLSGDTVDFGATVYLVDEDTDKEIHYRLLSEFEADVEKNIISIDSPIGRSLFGKKVGDSVEIKVPSGTRIFEILDIKWEK